MFARSRRKKVFLLVIASLTGTLLSYELLMMRNHVIAVSQITSDHQAKYYQQFEEPIGPNFFFIGRSDVPTNGVLPRWVADNFCVNGCFECTYTDKKIDEEVIDTMSNLLHLRYLILVRCDLPRDGVIKFSDLRYLRSLKLIDTSLRSDQVNELQNLGVRSLEFRNVILEDNGKQLVESISRMKNLEVLFISNCGIGSLEMDELRKAVPNCKINPR